MPYHFKRHITFEPPFAKGLKAFLHVRAGLTRSAVPSAFPVSEQEDQSRPNPENIVWIFGSGRSGSTWLASMMGGLTGHEVWFEPRLSEVFGAEFSKRREGTNFIFSDLYEETWLPWVRRLVLDGARVRFPKLSDEYLVIKDIGGSGAKVLSEALPESRLILLVRDPRDVVASWIDANQKGGWRAEGKGGARHARRLAKTYFQVVSGAVQAHDSHEGPKAVIRYEDLNADTSAAMRDLYGSLGMTLDEGELGRIVRDHSWESIPEEKKGEGKFYRKAQVGSWKEDLRPEETRLVEEITAPILERFYSA